MGEVALEGFGSGSAGVNFKVVGGTTQPTTTQENTIWVNTDTAIPGWAFSATEPTEPAAGMVWLQTGTYSNVEFNALRKNGIQVYPLVAKQYINSAWVEKTAYSYQSGSWVSWWDGEIYSPGDLHETITGGWETQNGHRETVAIGGTGIVFSRDTSGQSGLSASVNTVNKIDITSYSSLIVTATWGTSKSGYVKIGLTDTPGAAPTFIAETTADSSGEGTISLDISSVSGEHYVAIAYYAVPGTVSKVVIK